MPPAVDRTQSAIRLHRVLGCLAIAHAVLCFSTAWLFDRYGLPWWVFRCWVALMTTWVFWPFAITLHRGRTMWQVAIPLFLSALLLIPCGLRFAEAAPRVFQGTARWPTPGRPNIVGNVDLGGGFREIQTEEFLSGGFESVYHGAYLHYRGRRVHYLTSRAGLSPSRAFFAYADSDDGDSPVQDTQPGFHVFVFRAADEQIFRLTSEPLRPGGAEWEWDEGNGRLRLNFSDGRSPEEFVLPPPKPDQGATEKED